jgi:hypothetical protein
MSTIPQKVPMRIIQAIEQEKLSKHHIIYYDIEHGWVCQQRDDAFINSLSTPAENNSSTNLPSIAHPLEELGPFGRSKNFDDCEKIIPLDLYICRCSTNRSFIIYHRRY